MQQLLNRKLYGQVMAAKIEAMGATAVAVANRWQLSWPEQVQSLVAGGKYLEALFKQTNLEKDVLAEAGNLSHLADHEILQLHEVQLAPPAAGETWTDRMTENMARMANDPEYRAKIAKHLF